jgi:hypothetical protein
LSEFAALSHAWAGVNGGEFATLESRARRQVRREVGKEAKLQNGF